MLLDAIRGGRLPAARRGLIPMIWKLLLTASRRLGWGVADQGMSSISNFAVNIYIARSLGATQYGAFSLAYVTYSFALNASRGLATDPLLVRFSGTDIKSWRAAVRSCTGTATAVGLVTGTGILLVSLALPGATRLSFLALGLTLPGLMLQDSWRFSFFALGRGSHAFINDAIWVVVLIPALVLLRMGGYSSVFWFVLAWGLSAAVAAACGPLQARVLPKLSGVWEWVSTHRDLGPRYLAEGVASSASSQLRNYGVGLLAGLAAVGSLQASSTLMGPFMVVFFGLGLVTLPEAVRLLKRSPRRMMMFCIVISLGLAIVGFAWGFALYLALPRGLGQWLLKGLWHPTFSLVLPATISIMGGCFSAGAGTGLHALGAARRSLRAMLYSSAVYVALSLTGAFLGGALGTVRGTAIATWVGASFFWWELRGALRDHRAAAAQAGDSEAEDAAAARNQVDEAVTAPLSATAIAALTDGASAVSSGRRSAGRHRGDPKRPS